MRELGYVEGQTIAIEYRWAEGRFDRLPELAAELVQRQVNILVTAGPLAVRAAQHATTAIPIVVAVIGEPVAPEFVASLARPGGNLTGQTFQDTDLSTKQLELLRDAIPQLSRVAVLWEPPESSGAGEAARAAVRAMEDAAQALGIELHVMEAREPNDFASAFAAAKTWGAQAMLQFGSPFFAIQDRKSVV